MKTETRESCLEFIQSTRAGGLNLKIAKVYLTTPLRVFGDVSADIFVKQQVELGSNVGWNRIMGVLRRMLS